MLLLQEVLADEVIEMNTYPQFGALLNQQLSRLDRTPAWLAKRLGVNDGTVSRWLNDGARPGSPESVVRIADILGISSQLERLLVAAGYGYQPMVQEDEADRRAQALDTLPPSSSPRHNLPLQTTPFVGRQAELDEVVRLLSDPAVRLVTILAPGGMGKTRLALEAAARQIGKYQHGVYFVPPAPQGDVDTLPTFIAGAVGYQFQSDARSSKQQLFDYLRGKQLLLVLDSFEHLLSGADLLHEILQSAPQVNMLVTSRERLKLSGETVFRLSGMDIPDQKAGSVNDSSAVQLFLHTARRLRPDFMPAAEDWLAIAEICRLVQGMPLGILLAAAWIEMLSPQEIALEVSQSIDFLAADLRDLPLHQRSISAILTQTWERLRDAERAALPFLSVFSGGFTRQAAQMVSGASLDTLNALIDKALLWRDVSGRFEIHELLGQYAEEQLVTSGLAGAGREAHCAYYLSLLDGYSGKLKSLSQTAALDELERERENIRAAWRWAVELAQVDRLVQSVEALCRFYELRGHYHEGEAACRAAAAMIASLMESSSNRLQLLAKILTWQSVFNKKLGRAELARQLCQQSLSLLDRLSMAGQDIQSDRAFTLLQMGDMMWYVDVMAARGMLQESLSLCRVIGDDWTTAGVLRELGRVAWVSGSYQEAQQYAQESLTLRRMGNDQAGLPKTLAVLSWIATSQGQFEQAERYAQEYFHIGQTNGSRDLLAQALFNLGVPMLKNGKFSEALVRFEQSRAITQELSDRHHLNTLNLSCSKAKLHLGQYAEAHSLAQLALTTANETGLLSHRGAALVQLAKVQIAGGAYQEAERLLDESASIYETIRQPTHLVPVYASYGYVAYHTHNLALARRSVSQLWIVATENKDFAAAIELLAIAALLSTEQLVYDKSQERALEIYTLALSYPYIANSHWFADVVGRAIADRTKSLPPEVARAARERGKTRKLEEIIAEIQL